MFNFLILDSGLVISNISKNLAPVLNRGTFYILSALML